MLCQYSNTTTSFLKSNYIVYILTCPSLKTKKIMLIFYRTILSSETYNSGIIESGAKINSCIRN